jgi:dATP pyrophosphohydrolase
MRVPFQVLVIPFRRRAGIEYAVLRRADVGWWQFVSGGGEDDETPLQAAERETEEELGIAARRRLVRLDSMATVPKNSFAASATWGEDVYVIPEYCFAIDVAEEDVVISLEHTELRWVGYDQARDLLKWDGNRNALWELRERLGKGGGHAPA